MIATTSEKYEALARSTTEWFENHRRMVLIVFSIGYWVVACIYAHHKLIWFDELHTYQLASLPRIVDIWGALLEGNDVQPPGYFVLAHISQSIFGNGHLGLRIPAIISFWLCHLCIFQFTRRYAGSMLAVCAMLLPFLTIAQPFSTEARSYAMVLLVSAASLLLWRGAREGDRKGYYLVGLGLSLAFGVWCHYYAVFLFFPIAVGELVHAFSSSEKRDYSVWITLGVATICLIPLIPLMSVASSFSGNFWGRPKSFSDLPRVYQTLLDGVIPALCAFAVLVIPYLLLTRTRGVPNGGDSRRVAPSEVAALVCMAALPVLIFVVAKTLTNAFFYRYMLFPIVSVGILIAWVVAKQFRNRPIVATTLLLVLVCGAGINQLKLLRSTMSVPKPSWEPIDFDSFATTKSLAVVADFRWFIPSAHYLSPDAISRFYIVREDADTPYSRLVLQLARREGINAERLSSFISQHRHFLVYGDSEGLLDRLRQQGATVEMRKEAEELYEVRLDEHRNAAP